MTGSGGVRGRDAKPWGPQDAAEEAGLGLDLGDGWYSGVWAGRGSMEGFGRSEPTSSPPLKCTF